MKHIQYDTAIHKRRRVAPLALISIATVIALAGCSDGGSGNAQAPDGSTGELVEAPSTAPLTEILQVEPLTEAPQEGKTVAIVGANLPTNIPFMDGAEAAAESLGWTTQVFMISGTVTPAAAMEQSINANVDFIFTIGLDQASLATQYAAASEAEIPTVDLGAFPADQDIENGHYSITGNTAGFTLKMVDWMINDSNGEANIAFVNIPEFPVLGGIRDEMQARISSECPECSFEEVPITTAQLGAGQVPSVVTSYLQTHPDVDYVSFAISDMTAGVTESLQATGILENVTITGLTISQQQAQAIAGGANQAWVALASTGQGYIAIDLMARIAAGSEITEEFLNSPAFTTVPSWVVDSPETAELIMNSTTGWEGPDGFAEQYEALWLVD